MHQKHRILKFVPKLYRNWDYGLCFCFTWLNASFFPSSFHLWRRWKCGIFFFRFTTKLFLQILAVVLVLFFLLLTLINGLNLNFWTHLINIERWIFVVQFIKEKKNLLALLICRFFCFLLSLVCALFCCLASLISFHFNINNTNLTDNQKKKKTELFTYNKHVLEYRSSSINLNREKSTRY